MTKLSNPVPIFYDGAGNLLDGGYIYIGVANADSQVQPLNLFWDFARTIPAAQPLRTIGGMIVNGVTPADVFFAEADFSSRIVDSDGVLVSYSQTTYTNATSYQPYDTDLSDIADQGTSEYGRSLLLLPDASALAAAAGTAGTLQKTGGTMTGAINRQGAGSYAYGATNLAPIIYSPQPMGSAAPSSPPPGSLWGYY